MRKLLLVLAASVLLSGYLQCTVAFPLTESSSTTYVFEETSLSAALIEDLEDGDWYINIHTQDFPDVEIRD